MLKRFWMAAPYVCLMYTPAALPDELCSQISQAAMVIMQARQNSEPMAAMMMVADTQSGARRELVRELVIAAYDRDLRYSQEAKRREINEFGNNAYMNCLSQSEP